MRKTALALTLSLSAFAAAQVQQTAPTYEQVINQTFTNLNGKPDMVLYVNGTEKVGDRITPFDLTLIWHQTGVGSGRTLKLSLQKRMNNRLTNEIRANGEAVYAYDYQNRTYSATAYHHPNPQNPSARDANYHNRLFATLTRVVSSAGPDSYLARLFQEALGDPAGTTQVMGAATPLHYRSWMPSRSPVAIESRSDLLQVAPYTYRDPVVPFKTGRYYSIDPLGVRSFYLYDNSPRRSIVFLVDHKDMDDTSDDELLGMYFGEASQATGRDRLTAWTLAITYPLVNPADKTYETQFVPYSDMRGWRPLASPGAPRG